MKTLMFAAGLVSLLLMSRPVDAQNSPQAVQSSPVPAMTCSSEMKKTHDMMMTTADATKKEKAMKEMAMADHMKTMKDEKGCMSHAGAAMKALH